VTHPLVNHDIARLQHQERVALAHAAIHAIEAREARSTRTGNARRLRLWLNRNRRTEGAMPQSPARTGSS
jgi:hypothetical protein